MKKLTIPELSLVVLIGASGSGKSTFARKHFKSTEIVSSDYCRGVVSDDENNQDVSNEAFDLVHYIIRKRLAFGKLVVVDATNVQQEGRKQLLALAREYHVMPVAIVINLPESVCWDRNQERPDRQFGRHVIKSHRDQLKRSLRGLEKEGFRHIYILNSIEEVDSVEVERVKLWTDRKDDNGPFDIIGDVHGCCDELIELLDKLGYAKIDELNYSHPDGRRALFLGDLVDRGPRNLDSIILAKNMTESGNAVCIPGNHENKFSKYLAGRKVKISHGLEKTINELNVLPEDIRQKTAQELKAFIDSLVSHFVLDGGKLVVAHAGMKETMQGRASGQVRSFALYGETTGETDEYGLPVRYNWAKEYRGKSIVVYGHTPVPDAEWLNNTICIDTGCVFGGSLTALRYPERELVSVPAREQYFEPAKPLASSNTNSLLTAQQLHDDMLDIDDVSGKRVVETRLKGNIVIRSENSVAALEVMSRFAADPKWLIYLPPTMSPSATSHKEGYLEYPDEAFSFYQGEGINRVICEEKHMGSRAIIIVCRNEEAALKKFGVINQGIGIIYSRTGRRFFDDEKIEQEVLSRIQNAVTQAGFWEEFTTEWICLDTELMPWSAKAQDLLRRQYAAVGAAAKSSLDDVVSQLQMASSRGGDVGELIERYGARREAVDKYISAYRGYCWPVNSVDDLKIAPFHIMATEGQVHINKDHIWHMETVMRLCSQDNNLLKATNYREVDLSDESSKSSALEWWERLTERGGEGMVIKPLQFISMNGHFLVQPAVKCRGREYLRIIYGPEYTENDNLVRLRRRGLHHKRSMAIREFALGIESLERFVRSEPLRRVHECAFGVLALESEPVDLRL